VSIVREFAFNPGSVKGAYGVSLVRFLMGSLLLSRLVGILKSADLSGWSTLSFSAVAIAVAAMMALGYKSRVACLLTGMAALSVYYARDLRLESWFGISVAKLGSFGGPDHLYFMGEIAVLLCTTPCGNHFSIDWLISNRKPARALNMSGVQLIRLQVGVMYFWTALNKLNERFLHGYVLEEAWITGMRGSLGYMHNPTFSSAMGKLAVLVVFLELTLAVTLLVPRWRKIGLCVGCVFHVTAALILPVWYFSAAMLISYVLFLDEDFFVGLLDRTFAVGFKRISWRNVD
jgi:hypothetical protein